jgi:phosphate transport system substrate-binding protein
MKKIIGITLVAVMMIFAMAGCAEKTDNPSTETSSAPASQAPASQAPNTSEAPASQAPEGMTGAITVISREEGSGTRGAFIELMGVEVKDADGNKIDQTVESAEIVNSTNVVMTSVAADEQSIGYISLGSLNETVKALQIDGVDATTDNILAGTYKVARPFNIATKGEISDVAADFIKFIMSADGQKIVVENKYISQGDQGAYTAAGLSGKIVVAGSSSVSPLMEKLAEAYMAVNSDITVELQTSDSTTGMTSAIEGVCDIGMASRELKDSELEKGLTPTVIAMDGIAIVVNNNNSMAGLTSEQVRAIYTGEITDWSELG